jgi:hypothetical protein
MGVLGDTSEALVALHMLWNFSHERYLSQALLMFDQLMSCSILCEKITYFIRINPSLRSINPAERLVLRSGVQ